MNYKSRTNEERTLKVIELLNAFTDCWNQKDLSTFGSYFTEDAEYTDVTGQSAIGIPAIIKQHEYPFGTVNKHAVFRIDNLLIRDLSENLLIVSAQWTTSGSQTPKGAPLPDRKGIVQLICELSNGQWLLKLVYNADTENVFFRKDRDLKSD